MHHRLLTLSNLTTFPVDASNGRALLLIRELFSTLPEILPPLSSPFLPSEEASGPLRIGPLPRRGGSYQQIPISSRQQDVTMIPTGGHQLELSFPSSMKLYTILLAIHCMEVASLTGTTYTDFLKVVKVSKDPILLA